MEQKSNLFGGSSAPNCKYTFASQIARDNSKSYAFNPNQGDDIRGVEELIKAIRSGVNVSIVAYSKRVRPGHWLALSKFLMEYDGVELIPVLWTNNRIPENSEWNVQNIIRDCRYIEEIEAYKNRYSGKTLLMIPFSTERQNARLRHLPCWEEYPRLVCGSYFDDPIILEKEYHACRSLYIIDLLSSGEAYLQIAPDHMYHHPWG